MKKLLSAMTLSVLLSACASTDSNSAKIAQNETAKSAQTEKSEEAKQKKSQKPKSKRGCEGSTGSRLRRC